MKLSQFIIRPEIQIQVNEFFSGKELTIAGAKWNENKDMVTVSVAITQDKTKYDKPETTNLYEKFNISVPQTKKEDLGKFALGQKIRITKVSKATVYGDYNNNLSMVADINIINE